MRIIFHKRSKHLYGELVRDDRVIASNSLDNLSSNLKSSVLRSKSASIPISPSPSGSPEVQPARAEAINSKVNPIEFIFPFILSLDRNYGDKSVVKCKEIF